nr:MAG TPA: G-protein coupled receptor [Bacteriophage sp.]
MLRACMNSCIIGLKEGASTYFRICWTPFDEHTKS